MNLVELTARLKKGEGIHTEFKEWPIHPDDLTPSIVAFANTDGGQVILGVDNRGQIVGIDENELDHATQFVDNVAFNNCEPPVTVVQETIRDERGRVTLVVNIPKGDQRPYRTNRGVYYVRTTSGRRQASREELLRLFQSAESLYYDETPIARSQEHSSSPATLSIFSPTRIPPPSASPERIYRQNRETKSTSRRI
ncbi:MAG: AlbA family DNA-binding domain-containing protein [bacterium]